MSDYNVQAIRESLHIGDGTGCGCVEVSNCCMEIQDALDEIERLTADCKMKDKRIDWTVSDNAKKAIQIADLQAEIERLTSGLKKANQSHELFERRWYLAKDDAERLQAENAKLRELVFELLETDNEFLTDWEIEARKILGV